MTHTGPISTRRYSLAPLHELSSRIRESLRLFAIEGHAVLPEPDIPWAKSSRKSSDRLYEDGPRWLGQGCAVPSPLNKTDSFQLATGPRTGWDSLS